MNGSHCDGKEEEEKGEEGEEREEEEEAEKREEWEGDERRMKTPTACSDLPLFLASPHGSHGQDGRSHPQSPGRGFS